MFGCYALEFLPLHRYRYIVRLDTIDLNAHIGVLERAAVPGSRPVIDRHVHLLLTLQPRQYAIARGSVTIGGSDDQGSLASRLKVPKQGLKYDDDPHVNDRKYREDFCGFHGTPPSVSDFVKYYSPASLNLQSVVLRQSRRYP